MYNVGAAITVELANVAERLAELLNETRKI